MIKLLLTQPAGFLGALSVLGLLKSALDLHALTLELLEAWTQVTRFVFDMTVGQSLRLAGIELPGYVKDYSILSLVIGGSIFRGYTTTFAPRPIAWTGVMRIVMSTPGRLLACLLFWPAYVIMYAGFYALYKLRGADNNFDNFHHIRTTEYSNVFLLQSFCEDILDDIHHGHYAAKVSLAFLVWCAIIVMVSKSLAFL